MIYIVLKILYFYYGILWLYMMLSVKCFGFCQAVLETVARVRSKKNETKEDNKYVLVS